jgi:hypothetical protein
MKSRSASEWVKANGTINQELTVKVLIPQVRPAHKYPNSPREMIHPPGGDNAVCM